MVIGERMAKMQKGTVDRISDLPIFILHDILLILSTKEAGRASILSKRWYEAWSSIPVLDFRREYFDIGFEVEDDKLQRYVEFIDKTMTRYLYQDYRIRKMYLEISIDNEEVENMVDLWIHIAVLNQIQELEIEPHGDIMYEPPEHLFCARSLNVLTCRHIALPYYESMELVSLKHLTLEHGCLNEDMLQRIISLCPLVELNITYDDLEPISLPWTTRVDGTVRSNLRACPLEKELRISDCRDLLEFQEFDSLELVNVDAPNLLEFSYNCKLETSLSLTRVADHCNAELCPFMMYSVADWFVELKEFLKDAKLFNSLKMDLSNFNRIMVEQDELRNIGTDPYKVGVLKLRGRGAKTPKKSSLVAFLDGFAVLMCCQSQHLLRIRLRSWS